MSAPSRPPEIALDSLDTLWFQVAGTICNLTCHHCFISCSPKNHSFGFLELQTVLDALEESKALGVKEYYFTGGEPFMNPALPDMLEATLAIGPASVLTNATLLPEKTLARLARGVSESLYSLELRVSIDGFSPETNDPIRGDGTFARAMEGVENLLDHDFLPIITAMRSWPLEQEESVLARFGEVLRQRGYAHPRLKILPSLQMGQESMRTRGYSDVDWVTQEMMDGYDPTQLLCATSRLISDRGVHVCPILLEEKGSLMGKTLEESLRPFPLAYQPCMTCYAFGSICTNVSQAGPTG
jgi:sulfatase maturation enzyme AslB (radical SAM superfamily)